MTQEILTIHRGSFLFCARVALLLGVLGAGTGCEATLGANESGNSLGARSNQDGDNEEVLRDDCDGGSTVSAKRIVRLSFNQVANSLGTLVNSALGLQISEEFELLDAEHRAFPPLQSPREGNSFTDQSWAAVDSIAQAAGSYVYENLESVTGCGAAPTDACALSYLTALAEKGYRRELTSAELSRFTQLYNTGLRGVDASVAEAIQYAVYAIFQSPQFLYRTEFGEDPNARGPLSQAELASMLAYFLTDDTPDQMLLEAAKNGELSSPEEIGGHVDRILETDAARLNLHGAMISYLSYPNLESQIIQDDAFTGELRASMYQEARLFLDRTLWSEPLDALLTSRIGYMDALLAPIYGIESFPPPGATPVEGVDSFYEVDLPANRTGLVTQAGFLANRSRPDHTSVVGRGLLIKNAFLCTETPAPSDAVVEEINKVTALNPEATEREMAELRMSTAPCANCHLTFDAYGLALDSFDVLGRHRDTDPHGHPIDTSVTLPDQVGGGEAADIVEVANNLASSGAFSSCMGQNLINYALADVSAGAATITSCAVKDVAVEFEASDKTFAALVRAVAVSAALGQRSQGEDQ